jgi:hypothetical protein
MNRAWVTKTAILVTPIQSRGRCLALVETAANKHASAACYRRTKDMGILAVVMPGRTEQDK